MCGGENAFRGFWDAFFWWDGKRDVHSVDFVVCYVGNGYLFGKDLGVSKMKWHISVELCRQIALMSENLWIFLMECDIINQ